MGASYREVGYLAHSVPGAPLFLLKVRRVISIWFTSRSCRGAPSPSSWNPYPTPRSLPPYSKPSLRARCFSLV